MNVLARICVVVLTLLPFPALAQAPGTLLLATPIAGAPVSAQAWRIRYISIDDSGRPEEVTGIVVAPLEARMTKPRNVLAWAHGTWGVTTTCAASSEEFFASTPGLSDAIRRGYVVVAPDYPGLGSAGSHGYLAGVSTARSVLDAVRAARSIPDADAGPSFAVWGESQGGHAALWTGQLARSYAPELRLVGVAAAAPPTDLVQNLTAGSDPSVRAFLTAFTAYSWSQHFGASLSTLGKASTQNVITRLARNNCVKLGAKPKLGAVLGVLVLRRDLRNVDLGTIQPWARIARTNSPAAIPYGVPFLIAQNPGDVIVAPQVTRGFAQRLCRAGGKVLYVDIQGKAHETSAVDSKGATLDWIDARFAGTAAPSNCAQI